MNDIVDETLGNADPTDYVRFVSNNKDEFKSVVHGFLNWQDNYCKVMNLSI